MAVQYNNNLNIAQRSFAQLNLKTVRDSKIENQLENSLSKQPESS